MGRWFQMAASDFLECMVKVETNLKRKVDIGLLDCIEFVR